MNVSAGIPRYNVLGVGVSALTLTQARDLVIGVRGTLRRGYICLGTAHGLTEARRDPALRRIYNESWLTTPDGMPKRTRKATVSSNISCGSSAPITPT